MCSNLYSFLFFSKLKIMLSADIIYDALCYMSRKSLSQLLIFKRRLKSLIKLHFPNAPYHVLYSVIVRKNFSVFFCPSTLLVDEPFSQKTYFNAKSLSEVAFVCKIIAPDHTIFFSRPTTTLPINSCAQTTPNSICQKTRQRH